MLEEWGEGDEKDSNIVNIMMATLEMMILAMGNMIRKASTAKGTCNMSAVWDPKDSLQAKIFGSRYFFYWDPPGGGSQR